MLLRTFWLQFRGKFWPKVRTKVGKFLFFHVFFSKKTLSLGLFCGTRFDNMPGFPAKNAKFHTPSLKTNIQKTLKKVILPLFVQLVMLIAVLTNWCNFCWPKVEILLAQLPFPNFRRRKLFSGECSLWRLDCSVDHLLLNFDKKIIFP